MPDPNYEKRRAAIKCGIAERDLSALLIWGEPHGTFGLLNATNDIGYTTNWPIRHPGMGPTLLVIPRKGQPTLLVSGPLSAIRNAEELSDIRDIRHTSRDQFASEAKNILPTQESKSDRIGIVRLTDIPVWFYERLNSTFSAAHLIDATDVFTELRVVKSRLQVERLHHAATTADLMFKTLIDGVAPGVQRASVLADMENTAKKAGAEFATTWVASGPLGGEYPHFDPHRLRGKFEQGDMFTVGLQIIQDNYWGHSIRMGTVGEPSDEQRRVYESVREAQQTVMERAEPGVTVSELYASIQSVYQDYGYENSFRSLHGLGLRYGGPPQFPHPDGRPNPTEMSRELEPGMVFELHPNIWGGQNQDGFAALGDMVVVTDDGVELMTEFPREMAVSRT